MKLSIVIICWNDLKVIDDCLRSILCGHSSRGTLFEVIVSDNGSTDGSVEFIREHYPEIQVIENRQNLGFARGNNVGIKASKGEWVHILNPDTVVHEGALDRMVVHLRNSASGSGRGGVPRPGIPTAPTKSRQDPFPSSSGIVAGCALSPAARASCRDAHARLLHRLEWGHGTER